MGYVVYNVKTTQIQKAARGNDYYLTEAAAKAGLTRAVKAGAVREDYAIASAREFATNIEKQVIRVNLLSGKEYMESANTPSYCSPSSEAYWSM